VLKAVSPGQLMIKICHEELIELMGGNESEINLKGNPAIILMSGLQGSGKTTFTGKLGNYLKNKKGKKVLLVACDVYRPAAIDQLHVLGEQLGIEVYSNKEDKDPVSIATAAINHARSKSFNVVIVDTAGRLAIDEQMMNEIAKVKAAINPSETLFVVDSMTGQDAVNTAKTFNERLAFDGVVLTKLDGDTRGGAALSIRAEVSKPIKFIGTGEKMDALDVFYPERMASRILGMGDVATLAEQAKKAFDGDSAKKLEDKFLSGEDLTLDDFLEQLEAMSKMGSMGKLLGMLPGSGAMKKQIENFDESEITRTKSIVQSMTPHERRDLKVLNGSRRARIALGAGRKVADVNALVDKFTAAQKMMKQMRNGGAMPGMPAGMPGLPPAPRKPAPPSKKKSKSGNPAKRALENGTIS
jgi:signal recognition particle subunit SRP54